MNKELEKQLVNEFPSFFREYGGDKRTTSMHWGCSHGDGWFDLIHRMCERLKEEADIDPTTDFHFKQIKEKFGTLRVSHRNGNKQMDDIVNTYEEMSAFVCENCGAEDNVWLREELSWIRTLCNNCTPRAKE